MSPRRAAKNDSTSSIEQNGSTTKAPSDDEMTVFGEILRKKGSSPIKYGGRNRVNNGPSPRAGASQARIVDSRSPVTPRKRALDASTTSDDDNDILLSPLSPLPPTPSPKKDKPATNSLSRVSTSVSGFSFTFKEKPWNIQELGDYVWVLITLKGRPFDPKVKGDSTKGAFIWWPAKITSSTTQRIKMILYGKPTSLSKTLSVDIKNPSADNVLAFLDHFGKPRFEEPSFLFPELLASSSPRKKRKHGEEIKELWQEAVSTAIREKQEHDYDGLPPIELALSTGSLLASATAPLPRSPKQKGKAKAFKKPLADEGLEEDEEVDELEREETPPPADERLTIPGEGVLCKDKDSNFAQYWPAQIQNYLVIEKRRGKKKVQEGRYKVLFLDGLSKDVPRDWFYSGHQDEFATCAVGKFQSEFVEDPDDEDSDKEDSGEPNNWIRSPSPKPLASLPSDTHFGDLTIHQQFCYTKPVLQAILNEQYQPGRLRHDKFMKGGPARKSLSNEAGLRGKMDPKDMSAIGKCLKEWCLRDLDRRKNENLGETNPPEVAKDDSDQANNAVSADAREALPSPAPTESVKLPSSSPVPLPPTSSLPVTPEEKEEPADVGSFIPMGDVRPRQKGCPAYEALSTMEKIGYCADVLLPESILQILLWRNGIRTSIEILSGDEEEKLHTQGSQLVRETDWVFDIMRMRAMHEKRVAKAEQKQNGSGSTSLRPRRSVRSLRLVERA